MLKINQIEGGILVEGIDNSKYPFTGKLILPANSVIMYLDDNSDMVTFKSIANNDTLFSGILGKIEMNGTMVSRDNIADTWDTTANAPSGNSSGTGGNTGGNTTTASLKTVIVTNLPASGESNTIYLIEQSDKTFKEYIWLENKAKFEEIGNFALDLTDYYTKDDIDSKLIKKVDSSILDSLLFSYQPKGDYATKNDLTTLQPKGDYATKEEIGDINRALEEILDSSSNPSEPGEQPGRCDELVCGSPSIYNDCVTEVGEKIFQNCSLLQKINLPKCTSVGIWAFDGCSALSEISLPVCTTIHGGVFINCPSIQEISLPKCNMIDDNAFEGCTKLSKLTLGGSTVCELGNSLVFRRTPIESGTGSIYVPSSLVETYKTANNWSRYSSRIFPIV